MGKGERAGEGGLGGEGVKERGREEVTGVLNYVLSPHWLLISVGICAR